jgi:hypothetical protein
MDSYTVEFPTQTWGGARHLILRDGQVFGDSNFVYTGTYSQVEHVVSARVHVQSAAGEFEMVVTGTLQGDSGTATGVIHSASVHDQLTGKITRERKHQP